MNKSRNFKKLPMLLALVSPIMLAVTELTGGIPLPAQAAPAFMRAGVVGQAPIVHRDSVNARDFDDYDVTFRGGEEAQITVLGDSDTPLNLYVYDESGNEISRSVGSASNCYLSFTPAWTGHFRIRIVNLGYVYSNYVLMTN